MLRKWLEQTSGKAIQMEKEWTHKISVSEPYNYEGADGKNLILGKIIKTFDKGALIFESKNELELDGNRGKYLLLHPRYEKQDLLRDFREGRYSTVNGGLLEDFQDIEDCKELEKRSKFVVIGGLEVNE